MRVTGELFCRTFWKKSLGSIGGVSLISITRVARADSAPPPAAPQLNFPVTLFALLVLAYRIYYVTLPLHTVYKLGVHERFLHAVLEISFHLPLIFHASRFVPSASTYTRNHQKDNDRHTELHHSFVVSNSSRRAARAPAPPPERSSANPAPAPNLSSLSPFQGY